MIPRVTYDESADAAYIYLSEPARGSVEFTHPWDAEGETGVEGDVLVDVGRDRKLVGIEVLNASKVLSANLLAAAENFD